MHGERVECKPISGAWVLCPSGVQGIRGKAVLKLKAYWILEVHQQGHAGSKTLL